MVFGIKISFKDKVHVLEVRNGSLLDLNGNLGGNR